MDYNELNDFLKNLEVKEKQVNNSYNKKIDTEFNTYRHSENKNALFINNNTKDVTLERELGLKNNINYELNHKQAVFCIKTIILINKKIFKI